MLARTKTFERPVNAAGLVEPHHFLAVDYKPQEIIAHLELHAHGWTAQPAFQINARPAENQRAVLLSDYATADMYRKRLQPGRSRSQGGRRNHEHMRTSP